MQFALLIYDDEKRWTKNGYDPAELENYRDFGREFAAAIKGGHALQPTPAAKTVRVREGKPLVTDGPFAETKEQLAGFYLVDAPGLEEAAKIAAKIPGARYGSVEVRPIMTFSS
ncbi:MAG TPA: YciI family protein [Bryobacteraceae bacterium]|nr:YciI family protein [Bryobacteraceae bacterium]